MESFVNIRLFGSRMHLCNIVSNRSSRLDVFVEKVFLKILQNSQENTCTKVSFLIKLQAWGL